MIQWVLIVHLLGGGYAETFASEAGCRFALEEAQIVGRLTLGREPGARCRQTGSLPARRDRPRRMVRAMA